MKVDKELWKERINNLIERRKTYGYGLNDNFKCDNVVADYASHVSKVEIGATVLDVGCGGMSLKKLMPQGVIYKGMDAFPVSSEVLEATIEEVDYPDNAFETIFVFAALDNFQDLDKAFANLKRIASKNIVFLTGVDIEVDKFHTFKITKQLLTDYMAGFSIGYYEELTPKVILIEFLK